MLNFELRCKCGKMMRFSDGAAYGPFGVDTENCRDPYFYCECGNEVDFFETAPNSESVEPAQQHLTGDKSEPADITPNCLLCTDWQRCSERVGSIGCKSRFKLA